MYEIAPRLAMIRLAHLSDIHITTPALPWQLGRLVHQALSRLAQLSLPGTETSLSARRRRAARPGGRSRRRRTRIASCFRAMPRPWALPRSSAGRRAAAGGRSARSAGAGGAGQPRLLHARGRRLGLVRASTSPLAGRHRASTGRSIRSPSGWARLWLIGVNSCTGNRWPWDAGGSVGPEQRERLRRLLEQLEPGPAHPRDALSGGPGQWPARSGARTACAIWPELVDVAARGGVCLWLHGHRHGSYALARAASLLSRSSAPAAPRKQGSGPTANTPSKIVAVMSRAGYTIRTRGTLEKGEHSTCCFRHRKGERGTTFPRVRIKRTLLGGLSSPARLGRYRLAPAMAGFAFPRPPG